MADRKITRKLKGNILMSCVTPAYLYGLETVELTEITEAAGLREKVVAGGLRE